MVASKKLDRQGLLHLMVVYIVWGSRYLGIRVTVREGAGFPPFTMALSRAVVGRRVMTPVVDGWVDPLSVGGSNPLGWVDVEGSRAGPGPGERRAVARFPGCPLKPPGLSGHGPDLSQHCVRPARRFTRTSCESRPGLLDGIICSTGTSTPRGAGNLVPGDCVGHRITARGGRSPPARDRSWKVLQYARRENPKTASQFGEMGEKMKTRTALDLIYSVVMSIPRGRVATYGQVAEIAGLPGRARQVGFALRVLPADSAIPWHRVVNARGQVSSRSAPDCELEQRLLLEDEGIVFDRNDRLSLERYRCDR